MIGGLALLVFGLAIGGALYSVGRYSMKAQRRSSAKITDKDGR